MKIIYTITVMIFFSSLVFAENKEIDCNSSLNKLKPKCNFIGKGFKSMKKFSSENQTIGQSLGIKKKSLKEISEENKTIDQTFRNIKEKFKK